MNHIFKIKRNAFGQSVVCSEITKSRTKGHVVASALAVAVAGVIASGGASANYDITGSVNITKYSTTPEYTITQDQMAALFNGTQDFNMVRAKGIAIGNGAEYYYQTAGEFNIIETDGIAIGTNAKVSFLPNDRVSLERVFETNDGTGHYGSVGDGIAIGEESRAQQESTTAVGHSANAEGFMSTALGVNSQAKTQLTTAIGGGACNAREWCSRNRTPC